MFDTYIIPAISWGMALVAFVFSIRQVCDMITKGRCNALRADWETLPFKEVKGWYGWVWAVVYAFLSLFLGCLFVFHLIDSAKMTNSIYIYTALAILTFISSLILIDGITQLRTRKKREVISAGLTWREIVSLLKGKFQRDKQKYVVIDLTEQEVVIYSIFKIATGLLGIIICGAYLLFRKQ